MADMIYNGKQLSWSPKGEKVTYTFKATSGLVDESGDYRFTNEQCSIDRGPLPEGTYVLSLEIDSKPAQDDGTNTCNLRPSWKIQSIPRGKDAGECEEYWANWGESRVRLEPYDQKTKDACSPRRGGFYLHDSAKGYTHGCIETEKNFFTLLRKYARHTSEKRLTLQIKYTTKSTYGETDK
ncbi:MAG: DUF2778 domain-containing protein [Candidatus Competibacter sp.]